MESNFIYVTYQHDTGLLRNVAATRSVFTESKIIVIDNDCNRDDRLQKELYAYDTHYQINTLNSRFTAYNLALQLLVHPITCFRTDDDIFNEHEAYLVHKQVASDLLVTPYIYDGELRNDRAPQRPIESIVFRTQALQSLGDFSETPSADWQLLTRAFESCSVGYSDQIILTKAAHGRP